MYQIARHCIRESNCCRGGCAYVCIDNGILELSDSERKEAMHGRVFPV